MDDLEQRLCDLSEATLAELRRHKAELAERPGQESKDAARSFAYYVENARISDLLLAGDLSGPMASQPCAVRRETDALLQMSHPTAPAPDGEPGKVTLARIERKIETLAGWMERQCKNASVPNAEGPLNSQILNRLARSAHCRDNGTMARDAKTTRRPKGCRKDG